ncbi:MAG: lipo-like protein, partial [Gammaproteobacteria bacterium]|nr:lipo-like protein [Gammaproteobacteria bacterium]
MLTTPVKKYESFSVSSYDSLYATLKPGDVLLVEGDQRFSVAVKYLTQSTWSHAAMFVGDLPDKHDKNTKLPMLIDADLKNGVRLVHLSHYKGFNTRICRPVGLKDEDLKNVINFMLESIGLG